MGVPIDNVNYSLCMHWLAGPIPATRVGFGLQAETLKCVAEAETCEAAGACLWIEYLAPSDLRCAGSGSPDAGNGSCEDDGGTLLYCNSHYAVHCGSAYYAPGTECLPGTNGRTGCGLEQNCSGMGSCAGSVLTYCAIDGLRYGINCAYAGYTCGINSASGYPCVPADSTVECDMPGATRCAESMLWVCDGMYESGFDCSAMGASCSETDGSARCVPAEPVCTPSDSGVNSCSGSSVDLCIGGQRTWFDRATIGLDCVPDGQGKSGHCG